MLDLSIFDDYTVDLLEKYLLVAEQDVERVGLEQYLDFNIDTYLVCSRVLSNGQRAMQTIGYLYAKNITQLLHIIDKFGGDKKDEYFNRLAERHRLNLEFEKTTPPEVYDKKKGIKSPKTVNNTTKENKERKPREKRPSAAQTKLAIKAAKLNALSINLPLKKK